jgi:hypothetical protein
VVVSALRSLYDDELTSRANPGWWNTEDEITHIQESIEMQDFYTTDEQSALLRLIKQIRTELKPGYTASMWCGGEICVSYYPHTNDGDSRIRHYVRNAEEWQALKNRLGL